MPATTCALGYTELEWERMWNSETATGTAHRAADELDAENFCEGCDSPVVYAGPADRHGRCGCDI